MPCQMELLSPSRKCTAVVKPRWMCRSNAESPGRKCRPTKARQSRSQPALSWGMRFGGAKNDEEDWAKASSVETVPIRLLSPGHAVCLGLGSAFSARSAHELGWTADSGKADRDSRDS